MATMEYQIDLAICYLNAVKAALYVLPTVLIDLQGGASNPFTIIFSAKSRSEALRVQQQFPCVLLDFDLREKAAEKTSAARDMLVGVAFTQALPELRGNQQ